ncbi:uncharacterized protein LOC109831349 [Asparagus officinalis]|uniref:uncharacterized protein LOC109831349 n=1 Tax=Asparagus officinalis TaxID=4686 RepID=UPI00098E802E|nr:uncharacterized protein LOC109831349 [Asparagus officinalis]
MPLLNPVSGVQIQLPSITTLPYVCDYADADRRYFLYKAILSLPPSADGSGDFTVILLHNPFRLHDNDFSNMAIMKVGDNSWTSLPRACHDSIADIIPHKGQLYGVDVGGVLHVWDHHHLTSGPKSTLEIRFYCGMTKLLVESLNRKLYMLYKGLYYDTFMAIRLDADNPEFIPEDDLGDNVFFQLGGNCIYFTDDDYFDVFDNLEHEPREMGVFDVRNGSMKPIPNLGQHLHWPPPIWIIPTLF